MEKGSAEKSVSIIYSIIEVTSDLNSSNSLPSSENGKYCLSSISKSSNVIKSTENVCLNSEIRFRTVEVIPALSLLTTKIYVCMSFQYPFFLCARKPLKSAFNFSMVFLSL